MSWPSILRKGIKEHGIEAKMYAHGIEVDEDRQIGRTYTASNSYGATTEVTQVTEIIYVIYDRAKKNSKAES